MWGGDKGVTFTVRLKLLAALSAEVDVDTAFLSQFLSWIFLKILKTHLCFSLTRRDTYKVGIYFRDGSEDGNPFFLANQLML